MRNIDKISEYTAFAEVVINEGKKIPANVPHAEGNYPNCTSATQLKLPTVSRIKSYLFRSNSSPKASPYFEKLNTWAAQSTPGEKRQKAVKIIKTWVKQNNSAAELNLSGLHLRTIPHLPDNIECLLLKGNQLTDLEVPDNLIFLDASNNALTNVSVFSDKLEHLNLSHNQITELSICHSDDLNYFNVFSNKLSNLPESILTLDAFAIVNVLGNPLSSATLTNFGKALDENEYRGPTIRLDSNISAERT